MTQNNKISSYFVTVATFYQENVRLSNQIVAAVEGRNFPFFGYSYSPQKQMFNYDPDLDDVIDFSRESIAHSQFIANFVVDEAKLSSQDFDTDKE
eukprot:CAMPEP_0202957042 /NCGR_PEP_ID=MMETSP1396-20130829/1473_1 /ASSEMBLY_ACC=CAM_ASM_000872 /TAXON_ID= /ORGANISM="Pseudokeronopsis sp., Strain Brazil" /LENGTH=94 /DNA_ID=CAMNT_0049674319 /DNA_START=797 /DNA_END=1081 /DNA_ORIENTATION=+